MPDPDSKTSVGKIVEIKGVVIDAVFTGGLPEINNAVSIEVPGQDGADATTLIAEVQQRSDATFRMFDHGRQRVLHIENAIAVANAGPADSQVPPNRLTPERTSLVSCPYFVVEKIDSVKLPTGIPVPLRKQIRAPAGGFCRFRPFGFIGMQRGQPTRRKPLDFAIQIAVHLEHLPYFQSGQNKQYAKRPNSR